MNRLRHALDSYYEEEGANDQITISLPSRSPAVTNGKHEKRWIVAELRKDKEDRAAEQQPRKPQLAALRSGPQANPRGGARGIAMLAAFCALGIVGYFWIRGSDRGKEKWRWTPGRELPEFGGSPSTFMIAALGVLKATGKRPPRIVVSSQHHPWWENQMAILDANGKMISEYWHSGALSYMTLADLYGDGKEEIVATGGNNDYLQAELVVLDPDRVFGASTEVRPNFQIHGMGAAQERLRLLFPRSDLNKALFSFNVGTEPTVEHGSIRLTVAECLTPLGCQVWYEFDKNLHLISAYAGDAFRSNHARFYQNGKDAHFFAAEEQAQLQKVRCLVGCKAEFVPVGNPAPEPERKASLSSAVD